MKDIKRSFDILTKEQKEKSINDIIAFYLDERDEHVGIIGANNLLDMVLQDIAPHVYNNAIEDTQRLLTKQTEEFDFELNLLKK